MLKITARCCAREHLSRSKPQWSCHGSRPIRTSSPAGTALSRTGRKAAPTRGGRVGRQDPGRADSSCRAVSAARGKPIRSETARSALNPAVEVVTAEGDTVRQRQGLKLILSEGRVADQYAAGAEQRR